MTASTFYTNVQVMGNRILYRGIKDGRRVSERLNYAPFLYSKSKEPTPYKSLFGENLKQHSFESISHARKFREMMGGASNIFGSNKWNYAYIAENFRGDVSYDFTKIRLFSIDIETSAHNGFPDVDVCQEEVLLITVRDFHRKKSITLGSRPLTRELTQETTYIKCADEDALLNAFVRLMREMDPDIITGWNLKLFDIPYLCNRILIRLGEDALAKLSPWGKVRKTEVRMKDRRMTSFAIEGVAQLDLLDLYKKFTFVKRESYKLDHIAEVELKRNKLENPYDSFNEFWQKDWELFVEYNIVDVALVDELEQKLGLIYLAASIAYIAKVNYEDVFSPVKTWDSYIKAELLDRNVFVEISDNDFGGGDDEQIEGAYVMEPTPGFYDWVASFDAASLYPSIIMMLNMSPETIVGQLYEMTPDAMLNGNPNLNDIVTKNYTMAANGVCYKKDHLGIMPELTKKVFEGRKLAKKKMLAAKQEYENTQDKQFKAESDRQGVIQLALKVLLNSLYGAMANKYFTFYDTRIAEGITLTGQYIIKCVRSSADKRLSAICNKDMKYGFYCDTDSVYLTLAPLVEKYAKGQPTDKIVDFLDNVCEKKVAGYFQEGTDEIHKQTNAYEEAIVFKREAIADRGFWVAKKKYALRVWDNEGVRYAEPDLKVMGIEIVRSSTPAVIRDWLKDCLPYVLDNKLDELREFINKRKSEYLKLDVLKIAKPGSANNLTEYGSSSSIFVKGCPIATRASLVYNFYLLEHGLDKKYELLREGDKMKFVYLKLPNRVKQNTIAFIDKLPEEFGITKQIDYELQWEKTFLSPINIILTAVGWELEEKADLSSFFG